MNGLKSALRRTIASLSRICHTKSDRRAATIRALHVNAAKGRRTFLLKAKLNECHPADEVVILQVKVRIIHVRFTKDWGQRGGATKSSAEFRSSEKMPINFFPDRVAR